MLVACPFWEGIALGAGRRDLFGHIYLEFIFIMMSWWEREGVDCGSSATDFFFKLRFSRFS